ncbi:MAG TPA: hypothetical protein VGK87_17795 [Anaerolineae bacterium]
MGVMMPWRKPTDDELISAYIDGQLDSNSLKAFEARIDVEPALRQRVDATRQLIAAARDMPPVDIPHNFILPRVPQVMQRNAPATRLWWRIGSVLAAAVFVLAIGLDTLGIGQSGLTALPVAAPVPRAVQSFAAKAPEPTVANAASATTAAQDTASGAAPMATAAPAATSAPPAGARLAATTTTSFGAGVTPTAQAKALSAIGPTATPVEAIEPSAVPDAATSQAAVSASAASQPVQESTDLLRVVALLALVVAAVAGFAGWVRR